MNKEAITMTAEERATEFVVFCIENTALRLQCDGRRLYDELNRLGALEEYLYPSYPTLHTQSKEYIVDAVLEYIYRHNPSFLPADYRPWTPNLHGKEAQS